MMGINKQLRHGEMQMKDVLKICLKEKGKVDIKYIASITGWGWEEVAEKLENKIYLNPERMDLMNINAGWETAEEYLTGDLLNKYEVAIKMNHKYPDLFESNIYALRNQIFIKQASGLVTGLKTISPISLNKETPMTTKEDIINSFEKVLERYADMKDCTGFKAVLQHSIRDCSKFKSGLENSEMSVEKIIKAVNVFKFWFRSRYQDLGKHYLKTISRYASYEETDLTEEQDELYYSLGADLCSASKEFINIISCLTSELRSPEVVDYKKAGESISKLKGLSQEEFREKVKKALKSTDKDDMQIVELGLNSRNSVRYFEEIMGQEYPELHIDGIPMFIVFPYEDDEGVRYAGIPYNYFEKRE